MQNKKSFLKLTLCNCLLAALHVNLLGQVQDSTQLELEGVQVIKQFQTSLKNENAISFTKPSAIEEENAFTTAFNYVTNPPDALEVDIPDPEIRTLAFVDELEPVDSKNGLLKLGYGNLKSPDLLGHYHYYIENWFEIGVEGSYYSAEDSGHALKKLNEIDAGIYAAYFLNDFTKLKLSGNGSWNRNFLYHPNFIPANSEFDEEVFKRERNGQQVNLSFHHAPFSKSKLILNTDISFNRFESVQKTSKEQLIGISNHWGKRFGKFSKLGVYLDFDYEIYSNKLSDQFDKNRIAVRPYLIYEEENVNLKAGVFYDNINTIWPELNISYQFENIPLRLNLSSCADSEFNTMERITNINEFSTLNFDSLSQYAQKDISIAGVYQKAGLEVALQASRSDHQNHLFFYGLSNEFATRVYDLEDYNVSLLLDYNFNDWLTASGRVEKKFLSWDLDSDPINLADILASVSFKESLIDGKIRFYQEFIFSNNRGFADVNLNDTGELSSIVDLNLGIDVSISEMFNLYASFNNILDNNYSLWEGYENFGRNFHGGLKLVF